MGKKASHEFYEYITSFSVRLRSPSHPKSAHGCHNTEALKDGCARDDRSTPRRKLKGSIKNCKVRDVCICAWKHETTIDLSETEIGELELLAYASLLDLTMVKARSMLQSNIRETVLIRNLYLLVFVLRKHCSSRIFDIAASDAKS